MNNLNIEEKKGLLYQKLNNSSTKLSALIDDLPESCAEIKSTDSSGEDPQHLKGLIESVSDKFSKLGKELDAPFKIAVVGSQGTGKSTVVNLLLGSAIMPSTISENEAAVIRLAYPDDPSFSQKALFILNDGTTKIMSIIDAIKIIDTNERSADKEEFVKSIVYVTFYVEDEQLKAVELINTPGMNVLTDDFYLKVQHLFVEADIIIWVNGAERILDSFNSWLIKKIYADNKKIIGLITFPDKLYKMDSDCGVTDVVDQFMEKIEGNQLMRINGDLALFVFNGRFAQIAESHNKNALFISDTTELEDDESKLQMLYNFLNHGFAYSDDKTNLEILKKHNLYGMSNVGEENIYKDDFDVNKFLEYCTNIGFCKIDRDDEVAYYTEKGKSLLGEASQFGPFQRFAAEQLNSTSLGEKYDSVRDRLLQILSNKHSSDTSKARLLEIRDLFEKNQKELSDEENDRTEKYKEFLINLKSEYQDWYIDQVDDQAINYADKLLEGVFERFEKEINPKEFLKEILSVLTPGIFKKGKKSPISDVISTIITESTEKVFPVQLEIVANEARDEIDLIMIKLGKKIIADISNSNKTNKPNSKSDIKSGVDVNKLGNVIQRILSDPKLKAKISKKITEMLIKIAQRDLRKKTPVFVKNLVKLIRKLLKEIGIKFAKKKVASTATKAGMGTLGWIMLISDIFLTANDVVEMYKEMKESIREQLEEEPSFKKMFSAEAEKFYNEIYNSVEKQLNSDFSDKTSDISYILTGLSICDQALEEMKTVENNL